MVDIYIINYLAIIIALASLLIAGAALFLSVLKSGKPVISIVKNEYRVTTRQVDVDESTCLSESYSGNIEFTVFIRNSGANETAYSQLAWSSYEDSNSFNIIVSDKRSSDEFMAVNILKPYEQNINVITVSVYMKYRNMDQIKRDKIKIWCVYNWLKKNKAIKINKKFDLTDVLVKEFLKFHNYYDREVKSIEMQNKSINCKD